MLSEFDRGSLREQMEAENFFSPVGILRTSQEDVDQEAKARVIEITLTGAQMEDIKKRREEIESKPPQKSQWKIVPWSETLSFEATYLITMAMERMINRAKTLQGEDLSYTIMKLDDGGYNRYTDLVLVKNFDKDFFQLREVYWDRFELFSKFPSTNFCRPFKYEEWTSDDPFMAYSVQKNIQAKLESGYKRRNPYPERKIDEEEAREESRQKKTERKDIRDFVAITVEEMKEKAKVWARILYGNKDDSKNG